MAKVKTLTQQPFGFWDESFNHIVVPGFSEGEFNMSEADFNKNMEILEACGDNKPFELTGSAGGVSKKKQPPQQIESQSKAAEGGSDKADQKDKK